MDRGRLLPGRVCSELAESEKRVDRIRHRLHMEIYVNRTGPAELAAAFADYAVALRELAHSTDRVIAALTGGDLSAPLELVRGGTEAGNR